MVGLDNRLFFSDKGEQGNEKSLEPLEARNKIRSRTTSHSPNFESRNGSLVAAWLVAALHGPAQLVSTGSGCLAFHPIPGDVVARYEGDTVVEHWLGGNADR